MKVRIYHNPRCSKSRATLALLKERGLSPEVIHYLETPIPRPELRRIIEMLGISPGDLVRKGESEFKRLGLNAEDVSTQDLFEAMLAHPVLIERPIVVAGDRARIGRPPESVLEIL